jgi:hypothetical protein
MAPQRHSAYPADLRCGSRVRLPRGRHDHQHRIYRRYRSRDFERRLWRNQSVRAGAEPVAPRQINNPCNLYARAREGRREFRCATASPADGFLRYCLVQVAASAPETPPCLVPSRACEAHRPAALGIAAFFFHYGWLGWLRLRAALPSYGVIAAATPIKQMPQRAPLTSLAAFLRAREASGGNNRDRAARPAGAGGVGRRLLADVGVPF